MGIPIGELQQRVSSRDFAEYFAFYQLEPFGPEREDLRAGIVASTIANVNRDRKKHPRPFRPDEFTPEFASPLEDDDVDELEDEEAFEAARAEHHAKIHALMLALGGKMPDPQAPPA